MTHAMGGSTKEHIRVLVTDPEQRASLATVRSLGRRAWHVETVGAHGGIAAASRYVRRHHAIRRDQAAHPDRFREAVRQAISTSRCDVVVPVTDVASRMLLGQDHILGAVVAGPTAEAYARASDKQGLLDAASRAGLRVPRQVVFKVPPSTPAFVGIPGPVVIKPARSVVVVNGETVRVGVNFAKDATKLSGVLTRYPEAAYPLLVQERTIGPGVGVFLLRQAGRTLLQFGHKRLREKPPAGGVSTYREALSPPADLVTSCERLLDALAYEGAAMIEFKQDELTGEFVLMEINARLWGSVQLAVDAGVDFPSALVDMALGRQVTIPTQVNYSARSTWELGELDHAIMLWRRSAEALNLPPSVQAGAGAALRALLDRRLTDHPEVFRWSDPKPFLVELGRWLRGR